MLYSEGWRFLQSMASDIAVIKTDVRSIKNMLATVYTKEMMMQATLDDLLNLAKDENTQEKSLIALLTKTKQDLLDALKNMGLTPAQQLTIDNTFAQLTQNATQVIDAINANTPNAPPVVVPPAAALETAPKTKKKDS